MGFKYKFQIGLFIDFSKNTSIKKKIMKLKIILQLKYVFATIALFFLNGIAIAQDKIVIEPEKVETWFERNQLWVYIGAGVLLLLIILGSSGSRKRKKQLL